jgi:ribosome-binding factor A
MSRRTDKVASVFQQEIGMYMLKLELPALTTVSKVEITPDLKWCKVFITVMGDEKAHKGVMKILTENLYTLQGVINDKMGMKIVPRVKFVIDHGAEYAAHITDLIRQTHEE